MKKFTILASFFLSLYTSESINVANASSKNMPGYEDVEFGLCPTSSPNSDREALQSTPVESVKWENAVFVPLSVISVCTEGLLNIAGAPAAFWGVANAYNMIDNQNIEGFRIAAMVIGGVAVTRYVILNIMNQNKYQSYINGYNETSGWGRFTKNMDDPVSYFKSLGTSLVYKVIGQQKDMI